MSGAIELPSPVISVVMPCVILLAARLSTSTLYSDWPIMSTKPGAITSRRRVDAPPRDRLRHPADAHDTVAHDADVGPEPGRPGSVDDTAAGEQQVAGRRAVGESRRGYEDHGENQEQGSGASRKAQGSLLWWAIVSAPIDSVRRRGRRRPGGNQRGVGPPAAHGDKDRGLVKMTL